MYVANKVGYDVTFLPKYPYLPSFGWGHWCQLEEDTKLPVLTFALPAPFPSTIQGVPSCRGQAFVDIEIRVAL